MLDKTKNSHFLEIGHTQLAQIMDNSINCIAFCVSANCEGKQWLWVWSGNKHFQLFRDGKDIFVQKFYIPTTRPG